MDLQLQCFRRLYNIFEVCHGSMYHAVENNTIQSSRNKLSEISYIDLADQVLETFGTVIKNTWERYLTQQQIVLLCSIYIYIWPSIKSVEIMANVCVRVTETDFSTIKELFLAILINPITMSQRVLKLAVLIKISYSNGIVFFLKSNYMFFNIFKTIRGIYIIIIISSSSNCSILKC